MECIFVFSNELGKGDKMQGLLSILSLFRNEFKNFNNTGTLMLEFIYHTCMSHSMTLKLL